MLDPSFVLIDRSASGGKYSRPGSGSGTLQLSTPSELLHYNPEEGSSLLQITSPSYCNVPHTIFGMCLTDISLGLSRNMKTHKAKLYFNEYRPPTRHGGANHRGGDLSGGQLLVIDPVYDVQYLNWWHPDYPHPFDR